MNIKVFKDYDEASFYCADLVASTINKNSHPILGLATGSSPLGVYQEIIRRYQKKQLDLANVTTFNLDEYVGQPRTHEQSYNYFMRKNFFDHVNIKEENINLPDGLAEDLQEECRQYSQKLLAMGGTDIQIGNRYQRSHRLQRSQFHYRPTAMSKYPDQCTVMDSSRFQCKTSLSAITLGMMEIFAAKNCHLGIRSLKLKPSLPLMTTRLPPKSPSP